MYRISFDKIAITQNPTNPCPKIDLRDHVCNRYSLNISFALLRFNRVIISLQWYMLNRNKF